MLYFTLLLIFTQCFVLCMGREHFLYWESSTSQSSQPTTFPCQTTYGKCQGTPELPAEVKHIGYEYSNKTGHWYKFHAERVVNWTEARQACEKDGARLAVPNNDEEAKVIMGLHARYIDAEILNTDWPDWVSVGIFWERGAWRTVDGQSLQQSGYSRWMEGYPGNDYSYSYVVMNRGGQLSTTNFLLYPFVCEKKYVRVSVTFNYN